MGVARSNCLVLQELPSWEEKEVKKTEIACQIGISQVSFNIEQDLLVLLEEGGDRGVV